MEVNCVNMRTFRPRTGSLPPAVQAQPVAISRPCRQLCRNGVSSNQHVNSNRLGSNGTSKSAWQVRTAAPAAPDLEAAKEPAPPKRSESETNAAGEEASAAPENPVVVSDSRKDVEEPASTSGQIDSQGPEVDDAKAVGKNGSEAAQSQQSAQGTKQGRHLPRNNPRNAQRRIWRRRGPVENFPFKKGDVVVGTVVGGTNGWRVSLEHDKDIVGFVSMNSLPHVLRDGVAEPDWDIRQVGLKREFRIDFIPEDLEYNGKGPLLSARGPDLDVIWARARQIMDVCRNEREHIKCLMSKTNAGGLLGSFEGLPLFVPYSYVPREDSTFNSKDRRVKRNDQEREAAASEYVGKMTPVAIWEINRENNKFLGNIVEAKNNIVYSSIKVGDLVWGEISSLEAYGVFIRLDNSPTIKALLHIGSISRAHVENTRDLFEVGERVHAVVSGVDFERRRVNLSTAEIEPEAGDMLFSKARVYENAEKQVQDFRTFVAQRQQEIASGSFDEGEGELEWNS